MLLRRAMLFPILVLTTGAPADSITVAPAADATLYQSPDGSIANGSGDALFTGKTLRSSNQRTSLLRFDLSTIPRGSLVTSVRLTVFVSRNNAGAGSLELRPCLNSWGEGTSIAFDPGGGGTDAAPGDATWLHRFYPSTLWDSPGGDIGQDILDSAPIPALGTGPITWSSPALLPLVRRWVTRPDQNFGWAIGSTSVESNSARRIDSRESSSLDHRPFLRVTFEPCTLPCCSADFNADGEINPDDLGDFITCHFTEPPCPGADFNADGNIDPDDLGDFITTYFSAC